jgi:Fe-S cluster biogenesis protein NfuA
LSLDFLKIYLNGGKMLDKVRIQEVLDKVRPSLQADGGDCELVNIREDNVIEVKLQGACGSCPMATLTLKAGIERVLKEEIPEVKEVISV